MFETVIRAAGAAQNNYQALQGFNRPQESGWAICKSEDLSDAVEFSVFMNMDYSGECKIISSPVEEGGCLLQPHLGACRHRSAGRHQRSAR